MSFESFVNLVHIIRKDQNEGFFKPKQKLSQKEFHFIYHAEEP